MQAEESEGGVDPRVKQELWFKQAKRSVQRFENTVGSAKNAVRVDPASMSDK